ncbi:helix-turn-helix domain-containing protein [Thalassobellus suaedae]|uniref:AraC family transcriptional regulator n=1 Tax=Thalassobellus suaedae TaxID=3074124 RepID=A0ABY9XZR3_9FLAO|nr:AraC family transcriptional regulator [Flavobacteriaceae bacterium HL-DH10]
MDVNKSVEKRHYLLIKNWTLFIFTISSFLFLRILYSIHSEKISGELLRAQNYSFLVVIPWFLVYGKILIHPEILYGYPDLKRRDIETLNQININDHVWIFDSIRVSNLKDSKVSDNIEKRVLPYISDIENFVNKEHPFRNTKFSFPDFAKAINIPKCHIYYIFKYHAIVTFEEYKNYCKIKDALKLIDEGYLNTLTLEELSIKVGFSSYNLFSTSFKKLTKLAPKEYLNRQNNLKLQNSGIIVFN